MVRGVLAPGMKIGPDGAIYLTDWIRGWGPTGEGRLWKLDSPEGAKSPARAEVKALIAANFSDRPVQGLVDLLKHEDMRVRMKAQFELVRRGDNAPLATAASAAGHQLSRIHAIWGLGQLLRAGGVQASAITPLLKDSDAEIRAQAAKVLGHARATAAAGELVPLVRDANPRVRFFATTALGRIGHRPAFDAIVAMLANDAETDVYLRNAGFVALERIGDRAAIAGLASHQSRGVRLAAVVALRRLQDAGVARFLEDRDALVVAEAAGAVNDEGGIVAALPALARTLERTDLTAENVLRRALNANLRVGDAAGVKRVADFAARQGISEELRIEAIAILGVWGQPSNLDRVDGSWLGPQTGQRAADAAQAAVVALAGVLSAPASTPAVKIAWLEAASKIGAKSQAAAILARLRTDSDATVRVAALRALQSLEVPEVAQGVQSALADADATVRMAAISAMPSMPLDNAAKVQNLSGVLAKGTPGEQQSALGALGRIKAPESAEALGRLADGIANGAVAPAIQLDLLEAMREHGAEPLQTRLDQLKVGRDLSTLGTALPGALATGGSLMRGRQVIQQNQSAQCARCHTIGNSKSDVGPDLNKIGSQLSREQLVQSLLDPSARLAPGFGQVSVTTRGGQKYEGVLRAESATEIVVEDAARGTQKIAVADIAARENGVSAMPPMGLLLSPREIRDVVEALANQK
jgi:putative heme-binding domain-containing protein